MSAPPRSDTSSPKRCASSYHRANRLLGRARALPNTTTVERTVQARSRSSALAYSSCKRTPRMESPSRKSGSSAGRRNAVEFFCKLLSAIDTTSPKLSPKGPDHLRIPSAFERHLSAPGKLAPKSHLGLMLRMTCVSAFGGKADITQTQENVLLWPETDVLTRLL